MCDSVQTRLHRTHRHGITPTWTRVAVPQFAFILTWLNKEAYLGMYSAAKYLLALFIARGNCIRQSLHKKNLSAILFETTEENWGGVYLLVPRLHTFG